MTKQLKSSQSFFLLAVLLLFACPFNAEALRSTKQQSHTDPDYIGYQPKSVLLIVEFADMDMRDIATARLVKDLEKRGISVHLYDDLFPPTRAWSEEDQLKIIEKIGVEAALVVTEGAADSVVNAIGTQTWGTASASGFGNYATASGNSTTTTIFTAKSVANFAGVLYHIEDDRIAWTADIYSKASGTLIVGASGDAKAAAKGVIKGLIENGHIPKKSARR